MTIVKEKHICSAKNKFLTEKTTNACYSTEQLTAFEDSSDNCCDEATSTHTNLSHCENTSHCDSDCCYDIKNINLGITVLQNINEKINIKPVFIEPMSIQEFNFNLFAAYQKVDILPEYLPPSKNNISINILFQVFII